MFNSNLRMHNRSLKCAKMLCICLVVAIFVNFKQTPNKP